jgi:hypothetical protein
MDDWLLTILRMASGGIFVWVGSSKLGRTRQFWSQVTGYRAVGPRPSSVLAAAIPPLEFVAGFFFATGIAPLAMCIVLLTMLTVFSGAIVMALVRRLNNECGCAGRSRVSSMSLLRNAALAGAIMASAFAPSPAYPGEPLIVAGGIGFVIIATLRGYRTLTSN